MSNPAPGGKVGFANSALNMIHASGLSEMNVRFELSISGRDDGTLEAVYISLRAGKVKKTQEIKRNVLLADYDKSGNILGIEILAPVRLSKITKLADQPLRGSFGKFVKRSVPQELVQA